MTKEERREYNRRYYEEVTWGKRLESSRQVSAEERAARKRIGYEFREGRSAYSANPRSPAYDVRALGQKS